MKQTGKTFKDIEKELADEVSKGYITFEQADRLQKMMQTRGL